MAGKAPRRTRAYACADEIENSSATSSSFENRRLFWVSTSSSVPVQRRQEAREGMPVDNGLQHWRKDGNPWTGIVRCSTDLAYKLHRLGRAGRHTPGQPESGDTDHELDQHLLERASKPENDPKPLELPLDSLVDGQTHVAQKG